MKKSTLIAGLGGAVVLYLLNYLFYGLSGMMDGYSTEAGAAISRGDDVMHLHLVLGHIIIGLALATIYSKWARGTHNFMHGFQFGAWLAIAFGLGMNLIWFATSEFSSLTGHLIDSVWAVLSYGIMCGVISIVTGKFEEE